MTQLPSGAPDARASSVLGAISGDVQGAFERNRRVLSFEEFFAAFLANPTRHARSAAQYARDVFDHFGTEEVKTPRGTVRRFRLFDCPWDGGRDHLVGHEEVQGRIYRALSNFAHDGRVNRLLLLHGPNGSAKSTLVACIARALEHYSTLDEGALYRFNWVFPSQQNQRGGIGFGGPAGAGASAGTGSFAHLDDGFVDARLRDELRDHPLLLIPADRRAALLAEHAPGFRPAEYLLRGDLGPKNKQIFEALLTAYKGDWLKAVRHVQVERFYLSRRYRDGLCTVEPQLAVDARARQVTMDRSLSALPSALQSVALVEFGGDLVDANRGLIEYADLLKRPLEAYKYLLGTVEQGRVPVEGSILFLDEWFIGSTNEGHLAAFKEIPEFQSFKGRMELVRVPYLLDYVAEERIFADQVRADAGGKHVAPHAAFVAALWSVLTRMRKPIVERYGKPLSDLVARLGPMDKADLYALGTPPAGLAPDAARLLVGAIADLYAESDAYPNYEGRTGASPREVKTLLGNAAQSPRYECLSPQAVLEEIEELCKNPSVYEFLQQEPMPGGYHENRKFVHTVRDRWLDRVDDELRDAMGLVDEARYVELFARYVTHVSQWLKKEKLYNPLTKAYEDADADFMAEVEGQLGVGTQPGQQRPDEARRDLISRIAGWSLDHPGEKLDYALVFPQLFARLRDTYFLDRRKQIARTLSDLLVLLTDGKAPAGVDAEARLRVESTLAALKERHGYCERCAREACSLLLRRRYT